MVNKQTGVMSKLCRFKIVGLSEQVDDSSISMEQSKSCQEYISLDCHGFLIKLENVMNLNDTDLQKTGDMIEIECRDRWSTYQRLQELEIPCSCSYYQPLKVQISSVTSAVQLWSVVRQLQVSRQALVSHLEFCRQLLF
jgi:hypothetical protein